MMTILSLARFYDDQYSALLGGWATHAFDENHDVQVADSRAH